MAKYCSVITYNGLGSMAMATAIKRNNNSTAVVDSGASTVKSQAELVEIQKMQQAAGFTVQLTQYTTGSLLTHAKDDALILAGTL